MKFVDRPEGRAPHYRFASHRTFRYWCLDVRLRRQAKQQCRVFIRNHEGLVNLDPSEVDEGTISQLMRIAQRYVANVPGTDGYWMRWQGKLEEALNQLQSLTTFTTYSAADHHWYDLFRLMPRNGPEPAPGEDGVIMPIAERTRLLIDNPHLADWWIWQRMHKFDEMFLGEAMANASWFWMRAEWQSRASLHIHGCSSWDCEGERRLTELSRRYLLGHIARHRQGGDEGGPADDGGVPDDEYERVQQDIITFLEDIGFTARNPSPPAPDMPVGDEARARSRQELERDMRDFPWDDVDECRRRYANLLTNPPTDDPNDYQVIVTPPNALAAAEGNEGQGPCDRHVNRHVVSQLLAWGGNVDFSPIVDHGGATTYMVKYASKGESSSKEAKKMLTTLVHGAAEQPLDDPERLTLPQILRRIVNCATTRRDMGVQEVMHMNLQIPMVFNNVEFVRAATQNTDVEVQRGAPDGGLRPVRGLLEAYARRMDQGEWAPQGRERPAVSDVAAMNFCEFAATFKLDRQQKIVAHTRDNRVVTFQPYFSNSATSPVYPDYCRSQLVKYRPWAGDLHNGWVGQPGETADTTDDAARSNMVTQWRTWAESQRRLPREQMPYGFCARDLDTQRRRRREPRGGRDNDPRELESDDENNPDFLNGNLPDPADDDDVVRRWSDGRDGVQPDWTQSNWSEGVGVGDGASAWVRQQAAAPLPRPSDDAAASGVGGSGPQLNDEQALAVRLVTDYARALDAHRQAADAAREAGAAVHVPDLPRPLRMFLTGTAGTGKTVVIREMVLRLGRDRFLLLAPTGNAACAIGGEVSPQKR